MISFRYLQYRENQATLTDPHGTALAKVLVSCIYPVLIPHQLSLKQKSNANAAGLIAAGSKRSLTEADFLTEFPHAKMRRMVDGEKSSSSSGRGLCVELQTKIDV